MQYKIYNDTIKLSVKKAPAFIRVVLFFFSFLSFLLPTSGMLMSMLGGGSFHIGFVVAIFLFGLLGFFMLRIVLWNTYGVETLSINEDEVSYEVDYKWFKDGLITIEKPPIGYFIQLVGNEKDKSGVLIIDFGEEIIQCVIKMKVKELEDLIVELNEISKTKNLQ